MKRWNIMGILILLGCGINEIIGQYYLANPHLFSRITARWPCGKECESNPKVVEERPNSCTYDNQYTVWYPVIIEHFNYKEDIPNEWMFNRNGDIDDQGNVTCNGGSYYGSGLYAYNNGNFYVNNGVGYLKVKKEWIPPGSNSVCPTKPYHFTNSVLYSEFNVKQGYFKAKLKLPNNPYMWPAFWLQKMYPSSGYSEIDVFEFYDHDWRNNSHGGCEDYSVMRMTYHGFDVGCSDHCHRGRRTPFGSFNIFHEFTLFFTDYILMIDADNQLKGLATRYYDKPWHSSAPNNPPLCFWDSDGQLPSYLYSCYDMQNLQGCNVLIGDYCLVYNRVYKDLSFPNPSSMSYQVRFSNWLTNDLYAGLNDYLVNVLENEWNNFSDVDKEYGIDEMIIYQPINCNTNQNVISYSDFLSKTKHTNFLGGGKITLSNYVIASTTVWPTYLLATNEIEINANVNDVGFEEGTFLRAEIIDCSVGTSGVSQRTLSNGDTLPPVLPIDYFENDSIADYPYSREKGQLVSETDNGALQLFPNPASDKFLIAVNEEDWYDLSKIELVNVLGQVVELPKERVQDVSGYTEGMYYVKFYFTSGVIVVKPLVIKKE